MLQSYWVITRNRHVIGVQDLDLRETCTACTRNAICRHSFWLCSGAVSPCPPSTSVTTITTGTTSATATVTATPPPHHHRRRRRPPPPQPCIITTCHVTSTTFLHNCCTAAVRWETGSSIRCHRPPDTPARKSRSMEETSCDILKSASGCACAGAAQKKIARFPVTRTPGNQNLCGSQLGIHPNVGQQEGVAFRPRFLNALDLCSLCLSYLIGIWPAKHRHALGPRIVQKESV